MNLSRRQGNVLGVLVCAGLMGYALFAQYILGLAPCPLCVFQRVGVITVGLFFFLAALHNPGVIGSRLYAGLVLLAAAGGGAVAGRHVYLQGLPPDEVPACGPGLNYMLDAFPFTEVLAKVFKGSGECADIDWSFLGLSMPMWVLLSFIAVGLSGLWWNWRRV